MQVRSIPQGFNPILCSDSYKLSHGVLYAPNVVGMMSYIEPRTNGRDLMIPFGMQMWALDFLSIQVTMAHIDEAEEFAGLHGEPFYREKWELLVTRYNGYWPVTLRVVPEGTPVPSSNVLATIECIDDDLFWTCSYLEATMLRAFWYMTTVATLDYKIKREIARFYRISGADPANLWFALLDFGGRGVTCREQAMYGGAAHLVNFMGSDTMDGVRAMNLYYGTEATPMAGFSVSATEHSVECSYGGSSDEEDAYLRAVLDKYAKPGKTVSIVIDGYDVYRAAEKLCTLFRDQIVASGAKVVFRPDSGDMMEVVPRILRMQEMAFGSVTNSKGYRKINHVCVLQGDGVDHMSLKSLLGLVLSMGYTADNVIFGSGGALLQKVNRDTFKFAMKASAILVRNEDGTEQWRGISKNPITDQGKKSKEGRLTLVRSKINGEFLTVNRDLPLSTDFEDVMITLYDHGTFSNLTNVDEIRARCAVSV